MVDSIPLDESCEMLDGEVNDEDWDKNVADSDITHILVKWGRVTLKC